MKTPALLLILLFIASCGNGIKPVAAITNKALRVAKERCLNNGGVLAIGATTAVTTSNISASSAYLETKYYKVLCFNKASFLLKEKHDISGGKRGALESVRFRHTNSNFEMIK